MSRCKKCGVSVLPLGYARQACPDDSVTLARIRDQAKAEGRLEAFEEAAKLCATFSGMTVGDNEYAEGRRSGLYVVASKFRGLAEKEAP